MAELLFHLLLEQKECLVARKKYIGLIELKSYYVFIKI